jgi:hypothetical protein
MRSILTTADSPRLIDTSVRVAIAARSDRRIGAFSKENLVQSDCESQQQLRCIASLPLRGDLTHAQLAH